MVDAELFDDVSGEDSRSEGPSEDLVELTRQPTDAQLAYHIHIHTEDTEDQQTWSYTDKAQ